MADVEGAADSDDTPRQTPENGEDDVNDINQIIYRY